MLNSKILIVEDEIIVVEYLKQRLEDLGHNIVGITAKGEEAITIIGETIPDLIIMNIILKEESDETNIAKIIRNVYNIPIIYLTESHEYSILEKAETTNPKGYILKPFDNTGI